MFWVGGGRVGWRTFVDRTCWLLLLLLLAVARIGGQYVTRQTCSIHRWMGWDGQTPCQAEAVASKGRLGLVVRVRARVVEWKGR